MMVICRAATADKLAEARTSRLPVVYVLGKKPLDVEHCVPSFVDALAPEDKRTILLKSDVMFNHTMGG
jgi:diphthamide biosynthesis protein 2